VAPCVSGDLKGERRRARRSLVWVVAAFGDVDLFRQDFRLELARLRRASDVNGDGANLAFG
jgi:hypothetical protein